jgi:predicted ATPase
MAALQTLAVANYRSIRSLVMPLGSLNLITGANGSGKSNLYRALRLLAEAAQGGIVSSLAREGGISSTLWAGPETISRGMKKGTVKIEGGHRKEPVHLRLGFLADEIGYAIDLGLPGNAPPGFAHDPEIKLESVWGAPTLRPSSLLAERRNAHVRLRAEGGDWHSISRELGSFESMLSTLADPERAPELLNLREQVRSWRFYDHFRADADAPARHPQIGTFTPALSHDGRDLAAALQSIRGIGDGVALDAAVEDAFPGASVEVDIGDRFTLLFSQHGLLRPLSAAELSDGTLRYLLWIAALLTPRPPSLMILNEPETSLHPDLLPALARLIEKASKRSQIWVVSHASRMIAALKEAKGCNAITLTKEFGETAIEGQGMLDAPPWKWPER